MKMHRVGLVVAALLAVGLTGCGAPKAAKKASQSTTQTKQASSQKKAAKSGSTSEKKASASSKQAAVDPANMDLTAIQNGDYTSLGTEWHEVAVSVNHLDGNGSVWQLPDPTSSDHLTVTADAISDGQVTLQSKTVTAKGSAPGAATYKLIGGALNANGSSGPHNWDFNFYPPQTWSQGAVAGVDASKPNITVWVGDQPYMEVFEPGKAKKLTHMDIGAIEQGDYASLNGKWANGQGETIIAKNKQLTFSNTAVDSRVKAPGTLTGLKLSIPSMNQADGTPKQVPGIGGQTEAAYKQDLTPDNSQGGRRILQGAVPQAAYEIVFVPAGDNVDPNVGDNSRDRIVVLVTQAADIDGDDARIYYRAD